MTPPKSSTQYLEEVAPLLGSVPGAALPFVCSQCLGPVQLRPDAAEWWRVCYPCLELFKVAPARLSESFVAATTVLNPSQWYSYLSTYKRSAPGLMPVIASVAWQFLARHRERIAAQLDGEPEAMVVVPSTRGTHLESQPLRKALALAAPIRDLLVGAVRHNGIRVDRHEYRPEAFDVTLPEVIAKRIVVIDDTWVTGARLISVCGALLEAGARSVLPFAIARDVNAGWCTDDHPYRREMHKPYNVSHWPR